MKLEIKKITNERNQPEKQINTPDGWKTLTEIANSTGLKRSSLASKLLRVETYEELIKPPKKYKQRSNVGKLSEDELWKGVSEETRKACESGSNKDLIAV